MSIDELLRDAMTDEVAAAPPATDGEWSAVEDRSTALRRARHQRRLGAVAVGVAAALLVGVIVVGVSNRSTRSPHDNLFVGDPTTTVTAAAGPPPAANVEATVALPTGSVPSGTVLPAQAWSSAREGRTDRELVVYLLGEPWGVCGADYAATVESRSDQVVITMTPVRDPGWAKVICQYEAGRVWRAFRVDLPEPLAGRQLVDGADPTHPRAAMPADILRVPTALPAGLTAQGEWLDGAWWACYAATTTVCSQRSVAGATVATIEAPELGSVIDRVEIPVGDKLTSPPDGRNGIDWLLQHWIWPDPSTPPYVQVTVHGRPALIFDRPGAADRFGDTMIVWTEGPTAGIDDQAYAIGASAETGLSGADLIASAESMQPAG